MQHNDYVELVSPVAPSPGMDEQRSGYPVTAAWPGLAAARVSIVENGKANALELLGAMQELLIVRHGAIRGVTVHKEVSGPIHDDDLAWLVARSDLVLVGSAD
jgi:hypothetical protein